MDKTYAPTTLAAALKPAVLPQEDQLAAQLQMHAVALMTNIAANLDLNVSALELAQDHLAHVLDALPPDNANNFFIFEKLI